MATTLLHSQHSLTGPCFVKLLCSEGQVVQCGEPWLLKQHRPHQIPVEDVINAPASGTVVVPAELLANHINGELFIPAHETVIFQLLSP